jgi:hypothetical protein
MFQICVPNQKVQEELTNVTFLKLFLNAMITIIKIQNILDIIDISKLWNLINVVVKKIYENIYLSVFYDFSKFDGSKKIKVSHS